MFTYSLFTVALLVFEVYIIYPLSAAAEAWDPCRLNLSNVMQRDLSSITLLLRDLNSATGHR